MVRGQHASFFQQDSLRKFSVPEDIGPGMVFFSYQPVDQAGGFGGFNIIDWQDFNAGLRLKFFFKYRLGKHLVDGSINHNLPRDIRQAGRKQGG